MENNEIIAAEECCSYYNIELSFVQLLDEHGLINLNRMDDKVFISHDELPNLEKISQQLATAQAELNKQQITTEQQRDLRTKYGKDLETLQKELVEQSKRLDALPEVDEKDRDQLVAALTAAKSGTTP